MKLTRVKHWRTCSFCGLAFECVCLNGWVAEHVMWCSGCHARYVVPSATVRGYMINLRVRLAARTRANRARYSRALLTVFQMLQCTMRVALAFRCSA